MVIEKLKINFLFTKSIFPIKKMWTRLDVPKCLSLGDYKNWDFWKNNINWDILEHKNENFISLSWEPNQEICFGSWELLHLYLIWKKKKMKNSNHKIMVGFCKLENEPNSNL